MILDLSYDHSYECEPVTEVSEGCQTQLFCYPGGIADGWVHGVGVKITPHSGAPEWIGTFSYGDISPNGVCGVYTHPNRDKLLVVSRGDGYLGNARNPSSFALVDNVVPILGVVSCRRHGIIIIHDFVHIVALGESGVLWETPRLTWDGIVIDGIFDDTLYGYGWDAPRNCNSQFRVNLVSGVVVMEQPLSAPPPRRWTPGVPLEPFSMGRPIGYGFTKGGKELRFTDNVNAFFNDDGAFTVFPHIAPLK